MNLPLIDYIPFIINVELFLLEYLRLFDLFPSLDISKYSLNIIFSFIEASITDKKLFVP